MFYGPTKAYIKNVIQLPALVQYWLNLHSKERTVMLPTKNTDKNASNLKNNLGIWIFYSYPTFLELAVIFKQPGETFVRLCQTLLEHFENHLQHLVALYFRIALQIHNAKWLW